MMRAAGSEDDDGSIVYEMNPETAIAQDIAGQKSGTSADYTRIQ